MYSQSQFLRDIFEVQFLLEKCHCINILMPNINTFFSYCTCVLYISMDMCLNFRMPSMDFTEDSSSSDALPLLGSEGSMGSISSKEGVAHGEGLAEAPRSYHDRLFAIGERKEEEEEEEVGGASSSERGSREKVI